MRLLATMVSAVLLLACCLWWWSGQDPVDRPSLPSQAANPIAEQDVVPAEASAIEREVTAQPVGQAAEEPHDPWGNFGPVAADSWPLRVLVLDVLADPVADALVEVCEEPGGVVKWVGRTNADGCVQLAVQPELVFVRATHPEIGHSVLADVERPEEGPEVVKLALWGTVQLSGVAIDADGRRFTHGNVSLSGKVHALEPGRCVMRQPIPVGPDGTFTMEVARGAHVTAALIVDGEEIVEERFEAEEGYFVVLAHYAAFEVKVSVFDKDHVPLTGAALIVVEPGSDRWPSEVDERMANGMPYGSFMSPNSPDDYPPDSAVGEEGPKDNGTHTRLVKLGPQEARVSKDGQRGRVSFEVTLQNPKPHVNVTLKPVSDEELSRENWGPAALEVVTSQRKPAISAQAWWIDSRGKATMTSLDSVTYSRGCKLLIYDVEAGESRWVTPTKELFAGGTRIELEPCGEVAVSVSYRGKRAERVRAELEVAGKTRYANFDDDGVATFVKVPGGPVRVRACLGPQVVVEETVIALGGRRVRKVLEVHRAR